jgi:hypothetical protein
MIVTCPDDRLGDLLESRRNTVEHLGVLLELVVAGLESCAHEVADLGS